MQRLLTEIEGRLLRIFIELICSRDVIVCSSYAIIMNDRPAHYSSAVSYFLNNKTTGDGSVNIFATLHKNLIFDQQKISSLQPGFEQYKKTR